MGVLHVKDPKNELDHEVKQNATPAISDAHAERIDRLVDEYKSRILTQLNAREYRETTRSDHLADKVALFAGSWKLEVYYQFHIISRSLDGVEHPYSNNGTSF